MIIGALLECKCGAIATNDACLALLFIAHFFPNRITSYTSTYYRCTLKTQEFRTKDFVVRSTHSIEHQKCKYCQAN